MNRHKIEDVIDQLKRNRRERRGCALLIGAGASVTAGIPLASRFVKVIKRWRPRDYQRAAEKTYPSCMGELSADDRRKLISRYIDQAKINWSHIAIAQMIHNGAVDRVLTPNFDPLVMRACALFNEFPAIHDMVAGDAYVGEWVRDKAIFHLHGQRDGFFQAHRRDEVNGLETRLAPLFQDCANNRTWIVIGYSGDNDPVFRQLERMPVFPHRLYWIGFRNETPNPHVQKLLDSNKGAFWISGFDADSFLNTLAHGIGCPHPPFLTAPFTHLKRTLASISTFKLPGQDEELDVAIQAQERIAQAIHCIEPGDRWKICQAEGTSLVERSSPQPDLATQLKLHLVSGDYETVIGQHEAIIADGRDTVKALLAQAYFSRAVVRHQAAEATGDSASLIASADDYARAVEIKPDMHTALNNWGNLLGDQAKAASGEEADRLFSDAYSKYQQALSIKQDKYEAYYNWANTLGDHAKIKSGEEADALHEFAYKKLAKALEIKNDYYEAIFAFGNITFEHARNKFGKEARQLLETACEKYAQIPRSWHAYHDVQFNWGVTLQAIARSTTGTEADRLFSEAYEKYTQALAIKPTMCEVLNAWGEGLLTQAKTKPADERDRLFAAAEVKLVASDQAKHGYGAYNLACLAALQGREDDCRKWLEEARDNPCNLPERAHIEADSDLDTVRDKPWFKPLLDTLPV